MLYPASLSLMFDEVKKAIASVIRNEEKDQVSLPNDWSAQPNFQIVLGARLPDFEWHMTKHKIVKFHELLDQTKADLTLMMFWPETPKEQELLECLEMLPKLKKCEAGKVRVIGVTYGDMKEFQTQVETVRSKLSDEIRDFGFTVIGDTNQHIAGKLGFCGPEEDLEEFTQSKLARTLFVIDRNKALRLSMQFPKSLDFSFQEISRVVNDIAQEQKDAWESSQKQREAWEDLLEIPGHSDRAKSHSVWSQFCSCGY